MRLPAVEETTNGAPSAMFYLRGLKPGVYTLIVRYRGTASLGDMRPTLYLPDKDHLAPRTLKPVSLPGAGRRVVAKVLMPQGILWDQEDWFSGTKRERRCRDQVPGPGRDQLGRAQGRPAMSTRLLPSCGALLGLVCATGALAPISDLTMPARPRTSEETTSRPNACSARP